MHLDLHSKAQHLLETLANSIHDREPKHPNPFCFKNSEIQVAEKWLVEFMENLRQYIPK